MVENDYNEFNCYERHYNKCWLATKCIVRAGSPNRRELERG
jgi:hypothetical protein